MRVLVSSPAFFPRVGGLEEVVALLSQGLCREGHEVVVVTHAEHRGAEPFSFRVARRPGPFELLRLIWWCDVFFQANVSLKGLWPLAVVRRPWVVSHHSWYCRTDGRIAWQDRLKRFLVRYASASIAVSQAMAEDLPEPCRVIGNPYRDDLFRLRPGFERDRELVFVGRLVSDKGVDLLVEALEQLAVGGLRPRLTVVGDGPEKTALQEQARRLGVEAQIDFLGTRTGEELVKLLNHHRILVAPSRYNEPFGIVALEGIACGCVVVGSEGGGLKEAIGPCGVTFPNGDALALSQVLARLLGDPGVAEPFRAKAAEHLAKHRSGMVASRYSEAFAAALSKGVPRRRRKSRPEAGTGGGR